MIRLENITKKYDKVLFDDFNLAIADNQITCILGESGAGKTTILKMISNLTNYEGHITPLEKIAYIFQEDRLIPNLTVYENLKLINPLKDDDEILEVLEALEIANKKDRYPAKLSGGEAKRVAIARAFLYDGDVILMDEPFVSLDIVLKYKLISYFIDLWQKKPKTVVFVTHDIEDALLLAQEILLLKDGKIVKKYNNFLPLPRKVEEIGKMRETILKDIL